MDRVSNENKTTAVVKLVERTPSAPRALVPQNYSELWKFAEAAARSKLYAVQSTEAAFMILQTGMELGLLPTQALRGIYIVQNRPMLSADLCVAVVQASGHCEYWHTVESTPEICTIKTLRRGALGPKTKTWTVEDAKRADLHGKGTWKAYPTQMLRHRCAADLAREVYSDVLLGLYCPAEFDDTREMRPDGEVSVVPTENAASISTPVDPLAAFKADVAALSKADDAVAVWVKHRAIIQPMPEAARFAAWKLLVERVETVGNMKGASKWLSEAVKKADNDPPPDGPGDKPRTGEHPAADVDAASEAVAAESSEQTAGRAWIERSPTITPMRYLANSFADHEGEFGADYEDCEAAYYRCALALGFGRLAAERRLNDARKAKAAKLGKAA